MTLLSHLFGVRPAIRHPVRIRRNVETPAADGVRLLATHYYPADLDRPPLVLLRSPYGRGNALDQLPKLLAERGYQVLFQSLRGTAGSGGRFDGFVIDPADADGTLSWLRTQPWFGDQLATWGASYLGLVQWELAARHIPKWKIALIQDAPSAFAEHFIYPGGWYDFFLPSMLADHARLLAAGREVRLLIGPWGHGRGLYTREGMQDALTALDAAMNGDAAPTGVRVFVTGANRWQDLPSWPPAHQPTCWYLHAGGRLSREEPEREASPSRYRYDPGDPTPTAGGTAVSRSAGPKDNRAIEARADVLTFTTAPLTEDIEVIGPVRVRLHARSSIPHVDYFARLCEVSPRGRSLNLCDGIVRLNEPGDLHAADVRAIDIELRPLAHRFRRGHRIRLQVSSGAHPRFGRNPGTGQPLATGRELHASEHEIFHDPEHPSAFWLPLTPGLS
ncbi:hypothetical protein GCM10022419_130560 [Nonomuraea rosea]|uniref:Xaa-Pro dipeptidyl-peptidase C-terminal domain-containing protein n=2 Tax=Nonomuraea rosea TaxID=638574 RepID=A0ABP7A0W0_9ACTN